MTSLCDGRDSITLSNDSTDRKIEDQEEIMI
jgi:hypothetical protein